MTKEQKRVMLIIRCLPEERKALKTEALKRNVTLTELILGYIRKGLGK